MIWIFVDHIDCAHAMVEWPNMSTKWLDSRWGTFSLDPSNRNSIVPEKFLPLIPVDCGVHSRFALRIIGFNLRFPETGFHFSCDMFAREK
ncbi:hypothetical protein TNCV_3273291 [Trichonephila clavipes]|nr:hypothetical protein TNCV_3273291 [Trichonephila clavipes]